MSSGKHFHNVLCLSEAKGMDIIMEYSKELTIAINKYNDNLKSIANKILNLQLDFNDTEIEMKNLYGLENKLSVINSIKARKESERLLKEVINEYGYILERKIRGDES